MGRELEGREDFNESGRGEFVFAKRGTDERCVGSCPAGGDLFEYQGECTVSCRFKSAMTYNEVWGQIFAIARDDRPFCMVGEIPLDNVAQDNLDASGSDATLDVPSPFFRVRVVEKELLAMDDGNFLFLIIDINN